MKKGIMSQKAGKRIGFVSTRLAGTDGVSLETAKWVKILKELDHECFFFAGECDWPRELTYCVPEAHFEHPAIQALQKDLFDDHIRTSKTSGEVHALRFVLKEHLRKFIDQFGIDLLIIENALSIPMNVPLGVAITELLAETSIPAIGHHHDFAWERERFVVHAASDYLRGAFPPLLPTLHHVIINSAAGQELARRTGASSMLIPNVMDFQNPPTHPDGYSDDLRCQLGIQPEEFLILQPTRIVPRKRIELAIELLRRLALPAVLVITHRAGDEGLSYQQYLQDYAQILNVRVLFASERFSYQRGRTSDGRKIYSLEDAYQQADLVTYPSTAEGFGNAFLETIYYRQPIVMGMYAIYRIDIQPKGFEVIGIGNVLENENVKEAREILTNPQRKEEIVNHNYELCQRHYSFNILRNRLIALLNESLGV
jgi:glycosyltransferase involved in cell wall biosynthesis